MILKILQQKLSKIKFRSISDICVGCVIDQIFARISTQEDLNKAIELVDRASANRSLRIRLIDTATLPPPSSAAPPPERLRELFSGAEARERDRTRERRGIPTERNGTDSPPPGTVSPPPSPGRRLLRTTSRESSDSDGVFIPESHSATLVGACLCVALVVLRLL